MFFNENLDQKTFRAWLRFGEIGSKHIYHLGFLMIDREHYEAVKWVGNVARKLSDNGALSLTQKRLGEGRYAYIAQKRRNVII